MNKCLLVVILSSLLLVGCMRPDCRTLEIKEQYIRVTGITMFIHDKRDRWGQVTIHTADHSLTYGGRPREFWREDIKDMEFIKYVGDEKQGLFYIKFPDEKERCLTRISRAYWDKIIEYVDDWDEKDQFITTAGAI